MRLSEYFIPVLKEKPAESQVTSHALMLRAGMIRQLASGIYIWLPLGLKVLENVKAIIRKNMDQVGCVEMLMPCIQSAELWIKSGRYDAYGKETLRMKDRHDNELLFGPTNEEVITSIVRETIQSYKDLPKNFYNIQWKFRDEIRPRFGVMRGREFLMKDGYSFDIDKECAIESYNKMYVAYIKTFREMGVSVIPVEADNGVIGGSLSHEFHILADTGESTVYYDSRFDVIAEDTAVNLHLMQSLYAAADDKHDPDNCPIPADKLVSRRGIEVGHIFFFGDKYSKSMDVYVNNNKGERVPLEMGSYGIGVSRAVAGIIESNHDEKGIVWPESVAPFKASIINLVHDSIECRSIAERAYGMFTQKGLDVLYDDTDERAGHKFATHDLIGTPWQIIVGSKKAGQGLVELKHRKTGETEDLPLDMAVAKILGQFNVL
ncbi:MAG UNVERIFIED_CONTAM: proline--tRNA ligase [Rickettsiaceae bacterium]